MSCLRIGAVFHPGWSHFLEMPLLQAGKDRGGSWSWHIQCCTVPRRDAWTHLLTSLLIFKHAAPFAGRTQRTDGSAGCLETCISLGSDPKKFKAGLPGDECVWPW